MQTPAEQHLVHQVRAFLRARSHVGTPTAVLNIGAGGSLTIEKALFDDGYEHSCDRVDIEACDVNFPTVRHCWTCPVEDMRPVPTNEYDLAFANYVLEHVLDIDKASNEIRRVLTTYGVFVASLPNPNAPEFIIAKHTPVWFHRRVRRTRSWETHYSYGTIQELIRRFEANGLMAIDIRCSSFVEGYLWRYPLIRTAARLYDRLVSSLEIRRLMGHVCITFEKSGPQ